MRTRQKVLKGGFLQRMRCNRNRKKIFKKTGKKAEYIKAHEGQDYLEKRSVPLKMWYTRRSFPMDYENCTGITTDQHHPGLELD